MRHDRGQVEAGERGPETRRRRRRRLSADHQRPAGVDVVAKTDVKLDVVIDEQICEIPLIVLVG